MFPVLSSGVVLSGHIGNHAVYSGSTAASGLVNTAVVGSGGGYYGNIVLSSGTNVIHNRSSDNDAQQSPPVKKAYNPFYSKDRGW